MGTREQTVERAVILAAGKSKRLEGSNKLLIRAAGMPVAEHHRRALDGRNAAAVVRWGDRENVRNAAPWLESVIGDDRGGGPVGALTAYFESAHYRHDQPLLVIFGDTLLEEIPQRPGSWVGVASAPSRVWDFHDGIEWTRGEPHTLVCVGLYRFDRPDLLEKITYRLWENAQLENREETHMAEALRYYATQRHLPAQRVHGWRDAGDFDAIKRIEKGER
jgi:hypothetical protein